MKHAWHCGEGCAWNFPLVFTKEVTMTASSVTMTYDQALMYHLHAQRKEAGYWPVNSDVDRIPS